MEHVFWLLELEINDGAYDDFEAVMRDMIANVEQNEPATLNYEWFISDDKKTCHIYERFENSEATLFHLGLFGEHFAERFMSLITLKRLVLHGDPSPALHEALSNLGAGFMGRWAAAAK